MDIFQNFQRGYHYLILDQKLTTQENQKFTKGVVHLRNFRPKLAIFQILVNPLNPFFIFSKIYTYLIFGPKLAIVFLWTKLLELIFQLLSSMMNSNMSYSVGLSVHIHFHFGLFIVSKRFLLSSLVMLYVPLWNS